MNWFRKKTKPEPKPEPKHDHDLNLLMLMQNVAESEHRLGKITDEEYISQLANIEVMGLKLSEKRICALEGAVNG